MRFLQFHLALSIKMENPKRTRTPESGWFVEHVAQIQPCPPPPPPFAATQIVHELWRSGWRTRTLTRVTNGVGSRSTFHKSSEETSFL